MTVKPSLQKMLQRFLQTEEEDEQIHEATGRMKPCWSNTEANEGQENSKDYK